MLIFLICIKNIFGGHKSIQVYMNAKRHNYKDFKYVW